MTDRMNRFLEALHHSPEVRPAARGDGGYIDGDEMGALIDGYWTAEQLDYALRISEAPGRTNIDDALEIVREIRDIRLIQDELKRAFALSDLDGGAKAAFQHQLWEQTEQRLAALRDQLMMVI